MDMIKAKSLLTAALLAAVNPVPITPSASAAAGGKVKSWGVGAGGVLGNGDVLEQNEPVNVSNLSNVVQVSAGCDHALALKQNGTVRAWGNNADGELGNGDEPTGSDVPVTVSGLDNVKQVVAGCEASLALKENGTVRAWGNNLSGELGNDDAPNDSDVPITVPGLSNVKQIAGAYQAFLALKKNGKVVAWGANTDGELGDGTFDESDVPQPVPGIAHVKRIAAYADGYHVLALKENGKVFGWGANWNGQIGDGTVDEAPNEAYPPTHVHDLDEVKAIATGYLHSLALKENGKVFAWGNNDQGQMGRGTTSDAQKLPKIVKELQGVKAIAACEDTSLALKTNGSVRAWGNGSNGQLGNGANNDEHLPVRVHKLSDVKSIAGGYDFCFALLN